MALPTPGPLDRWGADLLAWLRVHGNEDGSLKAAAVFAHLPEYDVFNPAYGVKDDGTDTTTEFQAVVDAVLAAGGGKVIIRKRTNGGTICLDSVTPKSGVHYVIDDGVTMLQKTGATLPMFYWPQSPRTLLSKVSWRGGVWQGDTTPGAEAARSAIYVILGQDILVEDVETHEFASAHVHLADVKRAWINRPRGFGGLTAAGRNMFEIKSTQSGLTDPTAATANGYAWITDGYAEGGPTAGFAIVASDAGVINQAIISGCIARDFDTFCAIDVEAGLAVDTQVIGNQAYASKVGINVRVTNRPSPGTEVVKQNIVMANIVDSETLALAAGIIYNGGKGVVGANFVRSSGTPLEVYGLANPGAGDVRGDGNSILPNTLVVCNADSTAGNRPFAVQLSGLSNLSLSKQNISMEAGCYMKDGYYLNDIDGLDIDLGMVAGVGRDGIRLTDVNSGTIYTGTILDSGANDDQGTNAAVRIFGADNHHLKIVLGEIRDSRGSPQMDHVVLMDDSTLGGIEIEGGGSCSGWTTSALKIDAGSPLLDVTLAGAPAVRAARGSTWRRTDGAQGTTLYLKESGTDATGWTAMVAGASYGELMTIGQGLIFQNFDRIVSGATQASTSGRFYSGVCYLKAGWSITNLHAVMMAAGTGQTLVKMAIYPIAGGAASIVSTDNSANMGTTGLKTFVLSGGPYVVPADGLYIIAFLTVGGTPGSMLRGPGTSGVLALGGVGSGKAVAYTHNATGLTDMPTLVPSAESVSLWVAGS